MVPHNAALGFEPSLLLGEVLALLPTAAVLKISVADDILTAGPSMDAAQNAVHLRANADLQLVRLPAVTWLRPPDVAFAVGRVR